jgi:hypothetical protein
MISPQAVPIRPATSQSHLARTPNDDGSGMHNAMLSSFHTSATESVLQWPQFDEFASLRELYSPIFRLEQLRAPLVARHSEVTPYLSNEEIRQIIQSFQSTVNFIYPTMAKDKVDAIQLRAMSGNFDHSVESCLALLVMALGCASQSVSLLFPSTHLSQPDKAYQQARRGLAEMFFDSVLKRIYLAHLHVTQEATQCLFFIG